MPQQAEAQGPVVFQLPKPLIEARVNLGDKGRFVIPAALREAMGAAEGDQLMLHMEGRELRVITREAAMLRSLADELIAERRAEALAKSLE